MTKYARMEPEHIKKRWVSSKVVCDFCKKEIVKLGFDDTEIVIDAKIGATYPEVDTREGFCLDCCSECFESKVKPALEGLGAEWHEYTVEDSAWLMTEHYYYYLGKELQALFPHVWSSKYVKDAFLGYATNQRKKLLERTENRENKFAAACLRVTYQAKVLLETGLLQVDMRDTPIYETLLKYRRGEFTSGEVIDTCFYWETEAQKAFAANPDKKTDIDRINEFLLKVRKEFWQ